MSYKHLTIEERCCIRKYYNDGLSYRKIAEMIGRSPSTISREINRNRSFMNVKPAYYPHTAQKKYLLRRSYCHRGMFQSEEVIKYIEEKLLETWSPEQIACTPAPIPMPNCRLRRSSSNSYVAHSPSLSPISIFAPVGLPSRR